MLSRAFDWLKSISIFPASEPVISLPQSERMLERIREINYDLERTLRALTPGPHHIEERVERFFVLNHLHVPTSDLRLIAGEMVCKVYVGEVFHYYRCFNTVIHGIEYLGRNSQAFKTDAIEMLIRRGCIIRLDETALIDVPVRIFER